MLAILEHLDLLAAVLGSVAAQQVCINGHDVVGAHLSNGLLVGTRGVACAGWVAIGLRITIWLARAVSVGTVVVGRALSPAARVDDVA